VSTGSVRADLGAGWDKERVNAWLRYHSEISYALTMQRTALESALIPVTAYIVVACVECYRRYPAMVREIAAVATPEELGRAGHSLATQIDPVRLWAVPNFTLVGRSVLAGAGVLDPATVVDDLAPVLDFWERAARAYRFDDGTHQAWDADGVATPYRDQVDAIVAACRPVRDDADRARMSRLNALVTSYLFLLWFDTRSGYQDTGPYRLADGRVLLLRSFNRLSQSHFPWSSQVASELPYSDVLAAFVLEDVDLRVTDFGTAVTTPEDYLPHVVEFGLFDITDGRLVPVDDEGAERLAAGAKRAQRALYRMIAAMDRRAKIDAGAYVYFTFLRPFAEIAGVELDWTVPRDSMDLYPFLELIEGNAPVVEQDPTTYYPPLP
jgi:hypothetical protein